MKENKNMAMLKGKTVVLGVTGGIAAYKSAALTSLLVKAGAQVQPQRSAFGAFFGSCPYAPAAPATRTGA